MKVRYVIIEFVFIKIHLFRDYRFMERTRPRSRSIYVQATPELPVQYYEENQISGVYAQHLPTGSSRLWHKVKVDSGIGLPKVNVLWSTLESS